MLKAMCSGNTPAISLGKPFVDSKGISCADRLRPCRHSGTVTADQGSPDVKAPLTALDLVTNMTENLAENLTA